MANRPYAKPGKDSEQVKIWLDPEILAAVDEYCERHQRSRSWVIEQGVRQWWNQVEAMRKRRAKKKTGSRRAA